jgi:proteasome lid subunit RPN8/RPN11
MILNKDQLAEIIHYAQESNPDECCGLIGGTSRQQARTLYPLRNVSKHPRLAYEAAPEDLFAAQRQMRERGETLLAIYHSHPRSTDPTPSETDVRQAFYPTATYLIVGLGGVDPVVKAFQILEQEQSWHEVEYVIMD